jgi:sugar fermentation stimulation protein A
MNSKSPLIQGQFIKRYKRFFADVLVDGEIVVAHVPNTGSMKTCIAENAPCFLTYNPDPKRKLKYTLERVVINNSQVGVNTGLPNNLVYEAWQNKIVPQWEKFDNAQKEVKINAETRLDMALWSSVDFPNLDKINTDQLNAINANSSERKSKLHFIEIKNVTMAYDDKALFPDAVTSRGAKHIEELVHLMELGHTCEMVYVIQRENIKTFEIAKDIDHKYDQALKQAMAKGLKVTALKVSFQGDETKISGLL